MRIIQSELNKIEPRFKEEIMFLLRKRGVGSNIVPLDFHLYYPCWLSYNFEIPRKEEIVEGLIKYNLWIGYHIFVQDDLIDQKFPPEDFHKSVIYSDYLLLKAALQLEELIKKRVPEFNKDILKIYGDYIHCILWEKRHMKSMNVYSEKDIRNLGNKYSPIKINNLIFTCLRYKNTNDNYLENLNSFLDNYEISIQLIDDIKDWKDDLKNKNFSYFLMEIIRTYNMYEKIDNIEEFERLICCSDVAENVAKKSLEYLYQAQSDISNINNPFLNELIKEDENSIKLIISNQQLIKENIINEISQILSGDI